MAIGAIRVCACHRLGIFLACCLEHESSALSANPADGIGEIEGKAAGTRASEPAEERV